MKAGDRVGRYVLGERIGSGGMAEVWSARVEGAAGFAKPVALKFMLEPLLDDEEHERMFVKEARLAAALQHSNLVAVFDFEKFGDRYFIVMERVEGADLRRLLDGLRKAGQVLPAGLALHLVGEVLKALRYVHERAADGKPLGLVHRDVSPHNILVGYSGEVKLSDFGIAKATTGTFGTRSHMVRGKLSYAAPEQLAGQAEQRSDQFAVGVVLWELLSGRRLFDGADEAEIVGKVALGSVPPLPDEAAQAVVGRMLSRDLAARFATTADALAAVLALPGYEADGAPLGRLLRLAVPSAADRAAATAVIPRPVATPASGDVTRTKVHGASATPTPAPASGEDASFPAAERQGATGILAPTARSRRVVLYLVGGAVLGVGVVALLAQGGGAEKVPPSAAKSAPSSVVPQVKLEPSSTPPAAPPPAVPPAVPGTSTGIAADAGVKRASVASDRAAPAVAPSPRAKHRRAPRAEYLAPVDTKGDDHGDLQVPVLK